MWQQTVRGLRVTAWLTVLTGLLYPGLVTGICQVAFPAQANGSLITREGYVVGSSLIGQGFSRPEYFHPRPSNAGAGYDASISGGSNLGPTSRKLVDNVRTSVEKVRTEERIEGEIPADLLTASASGLDPHLSPASAMLQVARVAKARGVAAEEIQAMARQFVEGRDLGVLGEPRVNVLRLNLALDERCPRRP